MQSFDEVVDDPLMDERAPSARWRVVGPYRPPADVGVELGVVAQAPEMGQHTEEVLLELGYDWERIAEIKDHRVIP